MTDERPTRIVRFGAGSLADLPEVCAEAGITKPLLVASRRGAESVEGLPVAGVYDGVRPHVPVETVHEAAAAVRKTGADGLVGLGGGSAVDTCKAVVAELAGSGEALPRIVAVPTTYAGAEWTSGFGMLLEPGRKGGGRHEQARPVAAIYDPELTLGLPLDATVGTSMNALAHCAEAYYHPASTEIAARNADTGATAISYALPIVAERLDGIYGRTRLLEGAFRAALALAESGLCLGHAMAQALGGRYGLPQGTTNAICLPAALRFNAEAVPDAVVLLQEQQVGVGAVADALVVLAFIEGCRGLCHEVSQLAVLNLFDLVARHGVPPRRLETVVGGWIGSPTPDHHHHRP